MAASSTSNPITSSPVTPASPPAPPPEHAATPPQHRWPWLKYLTPALVLLLAAAVIFTVTRDWNAWEGGRVEQVTDDAFVRGDLTPLSTKVAGIVRDVKVSDYQNVHAGDLLVELQDDDYQAQTAQAVAAVEAAKAAIENNRKQRDLQDARIDKALAGVEQAKSQIAAAEAGINAVHADVVRTSAERTRQEALARKPCHHAAAASKPRWPMSSVSLRKLPAVKRTSPKRNRAAQQRNRRRNRAAQQSGTGIARPATHGRSSRQRSRPYRCASESGYTKIHAPADGTVGERQVRAGQLVSPGTQV